MARQSGLILLIDDDEDLLNALTAIIKQAGYNVIAASDGTAGYFLAKDNQPDLVICDVMMPKPNGFEVFKKLKTNPQTTHIPVVFLTARVAKADKHAALQMGVVDYITKPFETKDLLYRIGSVIQSVRSKSGRQGSAPVKPKMEDLINSLTKELPSSYQKYREHFINMLEFIMKNRFKDPVEQEHYIRRALSTPNFINELINDMLLLINIEGGNLDDARPTLDLTADFQEIIYRHMEFYKEKNLKLNILYQSDVVLRAPRFEFTRSAIHLVDNAYKYSPDKGEVTVHLASAGNGGFILTVFDQGEGIPRINRDKVFERSAHFPVKDAIGVSLGVGLYIVRSVAHRMGGSAIVLDSIEHCGVQMSIPPLPTL